MVRPLLPTLRQKRRYISYQVQSDADQKKVVEAIQDTARRCVGIWGLGRLNMNFMHKYFNGDTGIVCVDAREVDTMRAILGQVTTEGNTPVHIRTIKVSGSLKKLR